MLDQEPCTLTMYAKRLQNDPIDAGASEHLSFVTICIFISICNRSPDVPWISKNDRQYGTISVHIMNGSSTDWV
jgi:hypothetical protein